MDTKVTNKILTLPNLISIIRLLLVPIFATLLVGYQNNTAAFIVFLVAVLTDFLDGAVARSTGQVSRLGQQLDPFVDRVLILTAVIVVFMIGRVPLWIVFLLVARDVLMLVFLVRGPAAERQQFKVAFIGKVATAINMVGFCSLILFWPQINGLGLINASFLPGWGADPAPLGIWFLYLGVLLAWAAGIYYFMRARQHSGNHEATGTQRMAEALHASSRTRDSRSSLSQRNNKTSSLSEDPGSDTAYTPRRRAGEASPVDTRRDSAVSNSSTRGHSGGSAWDSRASRQSSGTRKTNIQNNGQKTRWPEQSNRQASRSGNRQANKPANWPENRQDNLQGNRQGGVVVLQVLNTPTKMLVAAAIGLLLLSFLFFYGCDGIRNFGVIHQGVSVGTIDVGAMKETEAAVLLATELNSVAMQEPIILYASEGAAIHGITENTLQLGNGVSDLHPAEVDTKVSSWSISPATLNAEVNGSLMAAEAYRVGRSGGFFFGRLAANTVGVTIAPRVEFSEERLLYLEEMLTKAIGRPMINASMSFDGSRFVVTNGQDGRVVDETQLESMLQQAFFAEDREVVVPMVDRFMRIDRDAARAVAESTQQAISQPITLTYTDSSKTDLSWTLLPEHLGLMIASEVIRDERGNWKLVPSVDAILLEALIPELIGQIDDQVIDPLDAEFVVVDGELQIIPSQNGTGINYPRLTEDLEAVLFGNASSSESNSQTENRVVPIQIGILEPKIKTSEAEAFDFSTRIAEYTLYYPYAAQESVINIHVAANHLNSSVVAPQATWSLIETVGDFTPEKGFVDSLIIVDGNYVDGIGGGVCTAASAVFNTVWEAGYPIVERVNHSLRAERYPLGRDAAIAYPYADLKFQNDTDNYLLLTMTYTDDTVTCILWGISPGYVVESIEGEFIEGADFPKKEVLDENLPPGESFVEHEGLKASKIEVTRIVYDAEGHLKEKRVFYSSYDPTPEVTKVGPEN